MNYLAHARDVLDRPWVLAGTVLPDWIRITAPRARIRPWMVDGARAQIGSPRAELHEGLRRHFADDAWFHANPAFEALSSRVARRIRERHPDRPERRMRASFYAHILVEMLLDASLVATRPGAAAAFAAAVRALDRDTLMTEVAATAPGPVPRLPEVVVRFADPTVLEGYADDDEVVRRLGVMGARVRQPALPEDFADIVRWARHVVDDRAFALLP